MKVNSIHLSFLFSKGDLMKEIGTIFRVPIEL